ncbi:hypothetical protein [uncultured Clostridium sp.]|uniref:hypothetical protein n=1 Tax=uncultured Clostridium sp. TaxID=59620 RepID=UPI002593D3BA|nr:hypothetical protein [uncultured Clostridium sp.]
MIYKKCVMTIDKNKATLDEDIYLYRLDKNIELYFTIVNNKYRFNKGDMNNIILITNASFFQVRLYKNAEIKYTFAIQPTDGGQAILTITDDLIDDPIEVGDYDFQISLLDEEKTSMISMPIVSKQLHVCEPLVSDDATMGKAILGLSKLATGEIKNAFDSEGNYIREIHQDGDILSAELINKFEEANEKNTQDIKELNTKIWDIQNPFDISSISVAPNISQMGSTVSPKLTWNYTHSTIKSQTINNEAIENTLRTKTFTGVTATTTYTLATTSNSDVKKSKSATITFANGVYYGKSTTTTYDSALINGLTKQLSNSKNRTITVNAGAGEYIFYCIPSRLGTCSFNVGGFDGGFSKVATIEFTNSDGYAENYDIYKSDNANLGNTNVTIK